MNIKISRVNEKVHLQAKNESGNVTDIDGSPKIGGENQGPRPMEMVLMALGGCSSMDVLSILEKMKQKVDAYDVEIEAEREPDAVPALFTNIHVKFSLSGEVELAKAERAVELSMTKYCSVTKILEKTAKITHSVEIVN